jgi:hypothetical protein
MKIAILGLFKTTPSTTTIKRSRSKSLMNRFASTVVVGDKVLIGPGVDVDVIDVCNATHCELFDDRLPSGYSFGNSTTMMMSGISNSVVVLTDGLNVATSKPSNQYFYRTTAISNNNSNNWKSLMMIESRFDGCLLSLNDNNAVVYGGGRSLNNDSSLLSSIEILSFENLNNISVSTSTMLLSVARARSGCTSISSTMMMFVGGWLFDSTSKRPVASDVVDLINVQSNRVVSSRLSRSVVGASVASLKNVVVVTGGVTTIDSVTSSFDNAFDYGSISNNAVEQYNVETGEWQYISNALTSFSDQTQPIQRIAFAFSNQVIFLIFVLIHIFDFTIQFFNIRQ